MSNASSDITPAFTSDTQTLTYRPTLLPRPNPIDTQVIGNPCTKFVVPSMGSTIQVGASVKDSMEPASALDSSPMSRSSGKRALTASKMSFSLALSVSVTLRDSATGGASMRRSRKVNAAAVVVCSPPARAIVMYSIAILNLEMMQLWPRKLEYHVALCRRILLSDRLGYS